MTWIDIVIIVILGFSIFTGYRKGFFISILNIVGLVVSFFVAKFYHIEFVNYLFDEDEIIGKLSGEIETFLSNNLDKLDSSLDFLKNDQFSGIEQNINGISETIFYAFGFLLLWLIALIAIRIIGFIVDKVFSLPVLKEVNKVGGVIVGSIYGVIKVYAIMTVIALMTITGNIAGIVDVINNSAIAIYFYEYNIFLDIIKYYL